MTPTIFLGIVLAMFAIFGVPEDTNKSNHVDTDTITYTVKEGEVIIVDPFTGRLQPGRRWSEGIHQAIEAKEGVKVEKETRSSGSITFQNYFRLYNKLSGMTGTGATSVEEFIKVFGMDVIEIPPNKPNIREDLADLIYKNEKGKFKALVEEIRKSNETVRPILVGTSSIEKNE